MKKSKIITGLSAGFITAIALSSCSLVKSKSGVVLTYNGVDYTAEMLFADQKSAAAGEAKFNAVYKVAVRQYFNEGQPGHSSLSKIQQDARNKISGQKDLASSNASKNGTSYDTEWNKILTSNNVEDEQGLYDKFEYELEKENFDDQFYENKLEILKNGGYLSDGKKEKDPERKDEQYVDGYLNKKQPYHVKHILVKVSAAADNPTTGEITQKEAVQLSKVVKNLAEGENFGIVAKRYSDDTGSKDKFGDLGIMDRDTSFVNEFKLGTYLYESFYGSSTSATGTEFEAKKAKKELFGVEDTTTATKGTAGYYADNASKLADPSGNGISGGKGKGIGQIPYEAALMLSEGEWSSGGETGTGYADVDYKKKGFSGVITNDKAKFYPRNVIFNKYFNKNNIMVITPRKLSYQKDNIGKIIEDHTDYVAAHEDQGKIIPAAGGTKRKRDDKYCGTANLNYESLPGFKEVGKNNDALIVQLKDDNGRVNANGEETEETKNKILRDKEGRTIFVFRSGTTGDSSYQGIHFVCIERSPFIGKEVDGKPEHVEGVSSSDYFTYYYPGQETGSTEKSKNYPKYDNGDLKSTYVNYIKDDTAALKTRADSVKTKIKSHDSNLNTYVYKYLLKTGNIKFKTGDALATKLEHDINTWIERKIESSDYETGETWNKTWKTYYQKLEETTLRREPVNIGDVSNPDFIGGTISEACAIAYANYNPNTEADKTALQHLFNIGGVFYE